MRTPKVFIKRPNFHELLALFSTRNWKLLSMHSIAASVIRFRSNITVQFRISLFPRCSVHCMPCQKKYGDCVFGNFFVTESLSTPFRCTSNRETDTITIAQHQPFSIEKLFHFLNRLTRDFFTSFRVALLDNCIILSCPAASKPAGISEIE